MLRATLVALPASSGAGMNAYVTSLARFLPPHVQPEVRHLRRREIGLGRARIGRTASLWLDYRRAARDPGDVVHATDTLCVVKGTDVVTVHDLLPLLEARQPAARLHARLFGRRLRAACRVIALSEHWAERIARRLRVARERIRVIPQGCDVRRMQPDATPVPGFLPGARHVLYAGGYRPHKRMDGLVRAVAGLPRVRILRIGPEGHPKYGRACRLLAARLGVDLADVGFVPRQHLAAYLSQADVVFAGGERGGFGLVPLEAMACGTPAVLSDLPAHREVHGERAHYAAGDGPDAIRRALLEAFAAPIPATDLRRHAQRHDWQATAHRTAEVYLEAVEARPAGRRARPDLHGLRLSTPLPLARIDLAEAVEPAGTP